MQLDQEWVNAKRSEIAGWTVFHLIWSIMHDFAAVRNTILYAHAHQQGITGTEQENILSQLKDKGRDIQTAYEFMHERYSKYNFAKLCHEQAPEKGEAYLAALDAVKEVQKCLQLNVFEIDKIGKDVLQGKFGFVNDYQQHMLKIAFGGNNGLIRILTIIEIWLSAKKLDV